MRAMHPIVKLILAETTEAQDDARRELHEFQKTAPSDFEIITNFLRDCTDNTGAPILKKDERAVLVGGVFSIAKLQ
jgi:hypothetical protein